jgi:hypothetical protein
MSTRYDFELTATLPEDSPENVVQILSFLLRPGEAAPADEPDHPFFGCNWRQNRFAIWAMTGDPHAGDTACSFRRVHRHTQDGFDHYQFTVHLRFVAGAETIFEVGLSFASWLALWCDQDEFVGYFKAEDKRHPTLLYIHAHELYLREVTEPPQRATDGASWQ